MSKVGALLAEDGTPSKIGAAFAAVWVVVIYRFALGGLHLAIGPIDYTVAPLDDPGMVLTLLGAATGGLLGRKAINRSSTKTSTEMQP